MTDAALSIAAERMGAMTRKAVRGSLQTRFLIAYLLVGLLPMLFASELASEFVTRSFESHLKTWLGETASYFLASVSGAERQADNVARALSEQPDLLSDLLDNHRLPDSVESILSSEGYKLVLITDEKDSVAYSSFPVTARRSVVLGDGIELLEVERKETTALMVVGLTTFQRDGHRYKLTIGSWFDDDFLGHLYQLKSFDFRLYARSETGFKEIFRSSTSTHGHLELNNAVRLAMLGRQGGLLERHAGSNPATRLFLPMRDANGVLQGVILCALRSDEKSSSWITRSNVFLLIVACGFALSMLVGWLVSNRLTKPLRLLTDSAKLVTAGRYECRVPIHGSDEVSDLARVFNQMAQRLGLLNELERHLRRQDRLSALGKAAAGIAHEIRNPLGTICTSAELIRNRYPLAPRDQQLIENVIHEVRRIDRLVGDFMTLSKPESVKVTSIRPSEIVSQVLEIHAPEFSRLGISINIQDLTSGAVINGNRDALFQAILNIALNAAEAMDGGGSLAIKLSIQDGRLIMTFADSGRGIDKCAADRIFDPFFSTKTHGSGLGLAKVRGIMESHGGSVHCWNAVEGGAVFSLELPLA